MNPRIPTARSDPASRIRAIAAGLTAAGVSTTANGNNITGLDVTATSRSPGHAKTEIMLDEDGYAEIRWFINPSAPPEEVSAALARILAAISTTPSALAPAPSPARP